MDAPTPLAMAGDKAGKEGSPTTWKYPRQKSWSLSALALYVSQLSPSPPSQPPPTGRFSTVSASTTADQSGPQDTVDVLGLGRCPFRLTYQVTHGSPTGPIRPAERFQTVVGILPLQHSQEKQHHQAITCQAGKGPQGGLETHGIHLDSVSGGEGHRRP